MAILVSHLYDKCRVAVYRQAIEIYIFPNMLPNIATHITSYLSKRRVRENWKQREMGIWYEKSYCLQDMSGLRLNQGLIHYKDHFHYRNSIVEINYLTIVFVSTLGFLILVKRHIYIESGDRADNVHPFYIHTPRCFMKLKPFDECY